MIYLEKSYYLMQFPHAPLMAKSTKEKFKYYYKIKEATKLVSPLPHIRNLRLYTACGFNKQYYPSCARTLQNRGKTHQKNQNKLL